MRFLLAFSLAFFITGCVRVEGVPNFERMSEEELFEYNQGRPVAQMIVCTEQGRSFSRVRRRYCATVEQMYGSEEQAAQLGVLNQLPGAINGAGF